MNKIRSYKQIAIILFSIVLGLLILIKIYGEYPYLTFSAGIFAVLSLILLLTSEVKKTKEPIRPFRMFLIAIVVLSIIVFITYLFRDSKYIKIILTLFIVVAGIGNYVYKFIKSKKKIECKGLTK